MPVLLILLLLIIILCISQIKIVPQANAWIVEALGKYHATWEAGLHLKVPFIYRIAKKVSLKEQVLDFPPFLQPAGRTLGPPLPESARHRRNGPGRTLC